jgi:hypothetical protein
MQLLMAEQHKCQKEETRENVLHEYKSRSRCLINRILLRCNKNNVIPTPINCHSSITCTTPTRFAVAVDVGDTDPNRPTQRISNNSSRSFDCIAAPYSRCNEAGSFMQEGMWMPSAFRT